MSTDESWLASVFSLAGKGVLITGAGGGIGSVLALALARAGAVVGISDVALTRLQDTARMIREAGGQAVTLQADLSRTDSCTKLASEARATLGSLDVLINCAAINRREPIEQVSEESYHAIMAVNLESTFFLCQAVHPIMREQGGGKIINVGSINCFYGLGSVSVYGATKAAVSQLTRVMAVEWARDNIQVNCLAPGFILTPLTEESLWGVEDTRDWLLDRIPSRRPGKPDELVGAVLLMASAASAYMTGETLVVDGGFLAGGWWERGLS